MKSFFIGKYEIKLPIIQGGMGVGVSLKRARLRPVSPTRGESGLFQRQDWGCVYPEYRGSYPEKCIYGLGQEILAKPAKKRTA